MDTRCVTSGDGFVFLIASHKNPTQVVRLARRIRRDLPSASIVIHHDRSKSNIDRATLPTDGTTLIDDFVTTTWGDASIVELETRALERIARDLPDFRWVVLLSGQDYPIRHLRSLPLEYRDGTDGFLDVEPPDRDTLRYELAWFRLPERVQTPRVERLFERLIYHFNDRQRTIRFASGRLGCTVGIRMPSPIPRRWTLYKGSNWWTLSRKAVLQFLTYKRERPALYRWFTKRTIIPDEGIFQTLLLNTPGLAFDGPDIRYMRWDDRNSGSPAIFTHDDLAELRASGRFFARKFDVEVDSTILDALDAAAADDNA